MRVRMRDAELYAGCENRGLLTDSFYKGAMPSNFFLAEGSNSVQGCRGNRLLGEFYYWWTHSDVADAASSGFGCVQCLYLQATGEEFPAAANATTWLDQLNATFLADEDHEGGWLSTADAMGFIAVPESNPSKVAQWQMHWLPPATPTACSTVCLAPDSMVLEALRLGMQPGGSSGDPDPLLDANGNRLAGRALYNDPGVTGKVTVAQGRDTQLKHNAVQMASFCDKDEQQQFSFPQFCVCGGDACVAPGLNYVLDLVYYVREALLNFWGCSFDMNSRTCCGAMVEPKKPGQHTAGGSSYYNFGPSAGDQVLGTFLMC